MKAKTLTITNLFGYTNLVNLLKKPNQGVYLSFRGQNQSDFKLQPSLFRFCEKIGQLDNIKAVQKSLITEFRKELITQGKLYLLQDNRFFNGDLSMWHQLSQAQHLGIPTNLLDVSKREEIAIRFAVEQTGTSDEFDGDVWVFRWHQKDNSIYSDNYHSFNPFEEKERHFVNLGFEGVFFDKPAENNRATQFGAFVYQNYEDIKIPIEINTKFENDLFRINIPKEYKESIRKELGHIKIYNHDDEINNIVINVKNRVQEIYT